MARRSSSQQQQRRGPKEAPRRGGRKKVCIFCTDRIAWVDYKDVNLLRRFMSERGKIRARRVTGNCAQHQREVAVAIKTAREVALLPYTQRTSSERPGRGGGRPPQRGPGRGDRDEEREESGDELEEQAVGEAAGEVEGSEGGSSAEAEEGGEE